MNRESDVAEAPRATRRDVLRTVGAGALVLAAAGCGLLGDGSSAATKPDPAAALRSAAAADTRRALAAYTATSARHPRLTPVFPGIVADHQAHLQALAPAPSGSAGLSPSGSAGLSPSGSAGLSPSGSAGLSPSGSAALSPVPAPVVPADAGAAIIALVDLENALAAARGTDAVAAPPELAGLLATIGASDAAHAAVLGPLSSARALPVR